MKHVTKLILCAALLISCGDERRPANTDLGGQVPDRGAAPDATGPDAARPDQAPPDQAAVMPDLKLDAALPDAPPPDLVSPPNTLGPQGGTVKSSDGKAELIVPPNALSKPVTFTLVPSNGAPAGAVGPAYDIGPASVKLLLPALVRLAYDKAKLGGALEWSLKLGRVSGGGWQARPGSMVDPVSDRAAALTPGLGTFGVISGGTQADVVKVLAVPPRPGTTAGLTLGAPGGEAPLLGVALDATGAVLKGAVLTYHSAKPAALTVDLNSGALAAKTLSSPPNKEVVTVTITASKTAVATLPVTVVQRTKTLVNLVGAFTVLAVSPAGEAPASNAKIDLVGASSGGVSADAQGKLTALPALHGASFNTLRVSKATHLDSHVSLVAPAVDQPGQTGTYRLYAQSMLPATLCGVQPRYAGLGNILVAAPPTGGAQGWTYEVTSPGAMVSYLDAAHAPDCTLEVSGSAGRALAINVAPGARWVVARKGSVAHARLVQVPAGAALALVRFDQ